jgi:hypothetical protein
LKSPQPHGSLPGLVADMKSERVLSLPDTTGCSMATYLLWSGPA